MKGFITLLLLLIAQFGFSQHEDVLVGENGNLLLLHLKQDYKPSKVLSYGAARQKMFGKVDNINGSVYCVYTNDEIYISANELDPKGAAYTQGFNTEHTYPQSKGATGNAKSNVHHLFPTRIDVNGARGHVPFEEIPDSQTDSWWYLTSSSSNIPTSNIELYSESDKDIRFEPQESHKGNVARAIMYFYTMYKEQADNADDGFFDEMLPSICQWNIEDAVDQREWDRTWAIAKFQSNLPNPFVLDCTLAQRSYCSGMNLVCMPDAVHELSNIKTFGVHPNPAHLTAKVRFTLESAFAKGNLVIMDMAGKQLFSQPLTILNAGANEATIDVSNWKPGFYIYNIQIDGEIAAGKIIIY